MIREVRIGDAPAVHAALVAALGYDCSLSVVQRRIEALAGDPHCISLVSEDPATGEVQGFIHALRYDTLHSEGGWDVISLAVMPVLQGRGMGRALLEACEACVLRRGGTFVRLNSRMERTDAHAFYEHLGYACPKTQKYFVKRLDDGAREAES